MWLLIFWGEEDAPKKTLLRMGAGLEENEGRLGPPKKL